MGYTNITAQVTDQTLQVTNTPTLASGGVNDIQVTFTFCDLWSGTVKTAVFYRNENEVYHQMLDGENKCLVPHEVATDEGDVYFGVFGMDPTGEQTRTSEVVALTFKKGAITAATKVPDPTENIYAQALFDTWRRYNATVANYSQMNTMAGGSEVHFTGLRFTTQFPEYELVGDSYYFTIPEKPATNGNGNETLLLINFDTGAMFSYKKGSNKLEPCTPKAPIEAHLAEVSEKGGAVTLTTSQLDALDNLFDLTAYTSDKGKDAYEAFVKAFGLDNYRVQREFTIDELFPCGLSYLREANLTNAVMSEYGYYTKQGTNRYGYIYFDIPCKYGYTYKFDFETTQSSDDIAIELYNEYALNQVEAEGDYTSADHKEYNWIGNGGEITPPELINGYAPAGLRFVFNTGTPGVSKIKISKKRVL